MQGGAFAVTAISLALSAGSSIAADVNIGANSGAVNLNALSSTGTTVDISPGVTISTGGAAISGSARAWNITNAGTIAAGGAAVNVPGPGISLSAGGSVTNLPSGMIDGRGDGVFIDGAAGFVVNAGTISSRDYNTLFENAAVELPYGGDVTNTGQIVGPNIGISTGRLVGMTGPSGLGSATIVNSGRVSATTHFGVRMTGSGTLTNTSTGVIDGAINGVVVGNSQVFSGIDATVMNDGLIQGGNTGLYAQYGGSVVNRGTISGRHGIVMLEAGTVKNAGVITGTSGDAIMFDYSVLSGITLFPSVNQRPSIGTSKRSRHTLILQTGSVINGNVNGGWEDNFLILEGAGAEDSHFENFTDLTMRGTRWTLSSSDTVIDRIVIESGALFFNGRTTGALTIGAGRTLGGRGTFAAIANSGTIAPGESIGTLTTTGDYTHADGATYEVEVDAAGQSDLIAVGARAVLSGGAVSVQAAPGAYAPLTSYTILTAAGGVTGTFATVTSSLTFLTPTLIYDQGAVRLQLQNNSLSGDFYPTLRSLGVRNGAARAAQLGAIFRENVEEGAHIAWLDGVADATNLDDGVAEPVDSRGVDIVTGATFGLRQGFEVGAYAGGGTLNVDASTSDNKAKGDTLLLGGYVAYRFSGFKAAASYARGWGDIEATRVFTGPTISRTKIEERRGLILGQVSYAARVHDVYLDPYVGLARIYVRHDAFTETGAGGLNVSAKASKTISTVSRLGLRMSRPFSREDHVVTPYAGLAWAREYSDRASDLGLTFAAAPNQQFSMRGVHLPGDSIEAEAGLSHDYGMWRLRLSYVGSFGGSANSSGVRAGLRAAW